MSAPRLSTSTGSMPRSRASPFPYGAVWFPNVVAPGWTPYRDGSRIWIAPWGWTWVGGGSCGFAPSHYGRWAVIGGAWGRFPGRRLPRPIYAPALVAFIDGFFPRNQPLVAWFPLAPGEVYWPIYTRNITYVRALDAAGMRDVERILPGPDGRPPRQVFATRYVNQRFAILVPERAFAGGRNVGRAALLITPRRLERVPASFAPPPVRPVVARLLREPPPAGPAHPPGRAILWTGRARSRLQEQSRDFRVGRSDPVAIGICSCFSDKTWTNW
jgi:hypothetical protein